MKLDFKKIIRRNSKIKFKIDFENKEIYDYQNQKIYFCSIESFPILSGSKINQLKCIGEITELINKLNAPVQIISYDETIFANQKAIKIKKFILITKNINDLQKIIKYQKCMELSFEEKLIILSKYFNNIKHSHIEKEKDGVTVDGHKWNFLLANEFLIDQPLAFISKFIYQYDCNYSLKIEYLNSEKLLKNQLQNSFNCCDDDLETEKYQVLIDMFNNKEKLIKLTYQLSFKDEAINKIDEVLDNFLYIGIKYRKNYFQAHKSFYQQVPINSLMDKDSVKYSVASNIGYAFPFYSEKLIDQRPNIFIGNSINTKEPILYNNFSSNYNRINSNELILGSSGCGKTTLLMQLIYFRNKQNYHQYIIDVEGKQLKKLTKTLEGLVIDGTKLIINPLQIRNFDTINPLLEHMQFLRSFFKAYNNQSFISDWHYNFLESIIEKVYNDFGINKDTSIQEFKNISVDKYPRLIDIYDEINKQYKVNNEIKYQECLNFLYPLTHGIDAVLFNQYTNFTFDKDLVCFDLSLFESNSEQKNLKCQYFNILSYIWSTITSKKINTHYQVYFDEFNVLIDPRFIDGIAFIKNISKRIRKYNAGLTCATQQIADLFVEDEHNIGNSILGNSCNQFIFKIGDLNRKVDININNKEINDFVHNANRGCCLLRIGSEYQVPIKIVIEDELLKIFKKCE